MEKYYNPIYKDSCKSPIVPDEEEIFFINEVFNGANLIYSIDRYFAYQGKIVEKWDERNTLIYSKGKTFCDYLPCSIGWPVVSFKVKEILESLLITNVQFLPIKIRNKNNNEINTNYYVLNILTILEDVIDLKQTRHRFYEEDDSKSIMWISDPRPKVYLSKINKYDIFRIKDVMIKIYFSDRLVEELKKRKISGFHYVEVITV